MRKDTGGKMETKKKYWLIFNNEEHLTFFARWSNLLLFLIGIYLTYKGSGIGASLTIIGLSMFILSWM